MHDADVVLHIADNLDPESEARFREVLQAVPGVTALRHDPAHSHLWVVSFRPDRVRSQEVLGAAHQAGFHGELVGL